MKRQRSTSPQPENDSEVAGAHLETASPADDGAADAAGSSKKQKIVEEKRRFLVDPAISVAQTVATGAAAAASERRPMNGYRPELDYLFPDATKFKLDKSQIWYDDEGLRFVTYAESARELRRWIAHVRDEWCPPSSYSAKSRSTRYIVDGTSGLGGNVIAFAKSADAFDRVCAVELDRVRHECLKHNVELYRLSKYVDIFNDDFVGWFDREYDTRCPGAVVFLDPPFGGDNYLLVSSIDDLYLYSTAQTPAAEQCCVPQEEGASQLLSGLRKVSLNRFVEYMLSKSQNPVPMVVLKLPINYDVTALKAIPTRYTEVNRAIHRKILFVALVGYRQPSEQPAVAAASASNARPLVDANGIPTVQSRRQFREIWSDTDLRLRLVSIIRGAQLFNCPQSQQRMENVLGELVARSIREPRACDDQTIYDELFRLVHEEIYQSDEYRRANPPKQVSENNFRTNSRVKQIHELLGELLHPSQRSFSSGSGGGRGGRGRDHQQRQNIPRELLGRFVVRQVLDLGCSEGAITAALGESFNLRANNIHGCDVRNVPATKGFTFKLVSEDSPDLPYDDNSMSMVTCLMSLHHIEKPEATLREVMRVLEPGGLLVVREHDCTPNNLSMLLDVMHGMYSLVWSKPREMPTFVDEYRAFYKSRTEWDSILRTEGFEYISGDGEIFSKYVFNQQSKTSNYVNAFRYYLSLYRKPSSGAAVPRRRGEGILSQ